MAGATIRIEGARQVSAAFKGIDRKLQSDFLNELKKTAQPVAEDAKGKVTRYAGASVNTIRPRRSGVRVFVEQSARKVTGKRGDFGALQMRTVLEPALEENADGVFRDVQGVLDRYARSEGF